jgi:hypothetical protein
MSADRFCLTARDGRPVLCDAPVPGGHAHHAESARCRWPLVVAAHMGWPLLATTSNVNEEVVAHSAFPLPRLAALLAALLRASRYLACRCPSVRSRPSCPTGPKGTPRPRAPPAPRAGPQRRLAKPGHGISPPSSSSKSTSSVAARSNCSPLPLTP